MSAQAELSYFQMAENHYGALELRRHVGPNMLRGLIISLLIHSLVVASPYIVSIFQSEEAIPPLPVRVLDPTQLKRLQRMQDAPEQVQIAIPKMEAPKAAIPIAVSSDEVEVDLERSLLPSQREIATALGAGSDDASLSLNPNERIEFSEDTRESDEIPEPTKFIPMEIQPEPLPDFSPAPKYPSLAQATGIRGRVVALCYIDKTGTVKKYQIKSAQPSGLGFEEEVGKVIMQWKFTPAIQNGKPMGVWLEMPFTFSVE